MDSEHENDPGICQAGQELTSQVFYGCQSPTAGYVFFPDRSEVEPGGFIAFYGECRWLCAEHLDFAVATLEHTMMVLS